MDQARRGKWLHELKELLELAVAYKARFELSVADALPYKSC
jgi:hypothetical protein